VRKYVTVDANNLEVDPAVCSSQRRALESRVATSGLMPLIDRCLGTCASKPHTRCSVDSLSSLNRTKCFRVPTGRETSPADSGDRHNKSLQPTYRKYYLVKHHDGAVSESGTWQLLMISIFQCRVSRPTSPPEIKLEWHRGRWWGVPVGVSGKGHSVPRIFREAVKIAEN